MTKDVTLHPDMAELMAAKQALTRTQESGVLRDDWNSYGARLGRPYPLGMEVYDTVAPRPQSDGGGEIKLRIYRPKDAVDGGPCTMFLHGGGFVKGSLDSGDSNAWGIADETSAVVVSVDYRLAPEHVYPAAANDVLHVLDYLSAEAGELRIDPSRIALWGDSAGANIAAVACLMGRRSLRHAPVAQVLVYGAFSNDFSAQSYVDYADLTPGHTTEACKRAWGFYLGGKDLEPGSFAAPALVDDVAGLPPAFIHYAEYDPLAGDSIVYAEKLTAAGVPTTLRCAKGMLHGFLRARFSGSTAANEFALPCMFLRGIFYAGRSN